MFISSINIDQLSRFFQFFFGYVSANATVLSRVRDVSCWNGDNDVVRGRDQVHGRSSESGLPRSLRRQRDSLFHHRPPM